MILLACAAERRAAVAPGPAAAAVDAYFLPTGAVVANPPQRHAAAKWLNMEQTGWTDTIPLHRHCRKLCKQCQ